MIKLVRHQENPIIRPDDVSWRSEAICNPATARYKGKIVMLTRCAGEFTQYISRIGYAESADGVHFTHRPEPVIQPSEEFDKYACEDPRITEIDGTYYITYAALSKPAHEGGGPPRTALASTTDFKHYKKHGIISPDGADVRDAVLFPEKINGKYVMLHRPFNWTKKDITESDGVTYIQVKEKKMPWPENVVLPDYFPEKPSIWIAYSDDLLTWYGHKVLMESEEPWESVRIGSGPPPIKTENGWIHIYHGIGEEDGEKKYKIGITILDLSRLELIARTKNPIFEPKEEYERKGYVNNVVFPTGTITMKDELFVYYGATDTCCCLATIKMNDILEIVEK